jgi:hypothetical protein
MKPITETCTPRKDVLADELTDQHFAVQLDVVEHEPDVGPDFRNTEAFFALHLPTTARKTGRAELRRLRKG